MSANPLLFPCHRCRVPAGEKCKNYERKNKQPCPDRGSEQRPAKAKNDRTPDLFGEEESAQ